MLPRLFKKVFKREPRKYYREWLICHGWGVMLLYDTTFAKTRAEAAQGEAPRFAYIPWENARIFPLGYYEVVVRVPEHLLELSDEELAHWFDSKKREWLDKRQEFI